MDHADLLACKMSIEVKIQISSSSASLFDIIHGKIIAFCITSKLHQKTEK